MRALLCLLPSAALLGGAVALPLVALLARAPAELPRSPLKTEALFGLILEPLWGSLRLGLASALTAIILGGLYAALVELGRPPCQRLWRALGLLPFAAPPYLVALGIIALLAPGNGPAAGLVGFGVYSWPSCALVLGAVGMPLVAAPVSLTLARQDPALLEAARLARGRWGVWRVLLGDVTPALLLGGALVFAASLARFTAPQLFRIKVLSELVFARFQDFRDLPGALLATAPLLLLALLASALVAWLFQRSPLSQPAPSRAAAPGEARRWPILPLLLLLTPALWLPLGVAIQGWLSAPEPAGMLLARNISGEATRSALSAGLTGLIALGCAALLVHGHASRMLRGPWLAGLLALGAIPGPILGVGMALFWNRPGPPWTWVYDSAAMGILAQLARALPLALLLGALIARRHGPEPDAAARLAGRSPLRLRGRMRELLPVAALAIAQSAGEYAATSLVSAPGYGLLAAKIVGTIHFGRTGDSAIMALLMLLMTFIPALLLLAASGIGEPARHD